MCLVHFILDFIQFLSFLSSFYHFCSFSLTSFFILDFFLAFRVRHFLARGWLAKGGCGHFPQYATTQLVWSAQLLGIAGARMSTFLPGSCDSKRRQAAASHLTGLPRKCAFLGLRLNGSTGAWQPRPETRPCYFRSWQGYGEVRKVRSVRLAARRRQLQVGDINN